MAARPSLGDDAARWATFVFRRWRSRGMSALRRSLPLRAAKWRADRGHRERNEHFAAQGELGTAVSFTAEALNGHAPAAAARARVPCPTNSGNDYLLAT